MPQSKATNVDRAGLLIGASELTEQGISTLPVGGSQGKQPKVRAMDRTWPIDHARDREENRGWKWRQRALPDGTELQRDYAADGVTGTGVICGAVSGHLQLIEFEAEAIKDGMKDAFLAEVEDRDPGLAQALHDTWWDVSPTTGEHMMIRLTEGPVPGNTKLASRPPTETEVEAAYLDSRKNIPPTVLIETRGEGGYFVGPGSFRPDFETNPDVVLDSWNLQSGNWDQIAVITPEQNATLFAIARSFDTLPTKLHVPIDVSSGTPTPERPLRQRLRNVGDRPGDIFNRETSWTQVLVDRRDSGDQWTLDHVDAAGIAYWRKPRSSDPWHATTNANGTDRLIVFSTATDFDADAKTYITDDDLIVRHTSYSKFEAECILGGWAKHPPTIEASEMAACADVLADEGYVSDTDKFFKHGQGLRIRTLTEAIEGMGQIGSDYGGQLWYYRDGVWLPGGDREVGERMQALLDERMRPGYKSNALDWFSNRKPNITDTSDPTLINFTNGMLRFETGELLPHHPDFVSTNQLPHAYEPDAQCPAVHEWIAQVVPDDCHKLVWEVLGYLMYGANPFHRAIMLLGSGRNGKGTLLRLGTAMLGRHNVSSIALQSLTEDRFAGAQLFGKLANIAGDLDARALKRTDVFKMITGGDTISAQRKNKPLFDFTPRATPLFAANEMPKTSDLSAGFFSRWTIIPFTQDLRKFGIDPTIENRLRAEMPGVIAEAVRALRRLMTRQAFTAPASVRAAKETYKVYSDPVSAYIDDKIVAAPEKRIVRSMLYSDFIQWSENEGGRGLGSKKFLVRFRARLDELQIPFTESRWGGGYIIKGIHWGSETPDPSPDDEQTGEAGELLL